jgi:hypothetical protein
VALSAQRRTDGENEFAIGVEFQHIAQCPRRKRPPQQFGLRVDSHDNDPGLGMLPQDHDCGADTVKARHLNVSDYHVGADRVGGLDQRSAISDHGHDLELRLKGPAQLLGDGRMIVRKQHTRSCHHFEAPSA